MVAAISAAVAYSLYALQGRREGNKTKREAIAKFRLAFVEEITQLDIKDAHSLMTQGKVKHDVAIYEFRRSVDSSQLQRFDEAVNNFEHCRSEVKPALLGYFAARATGEPVDNAGTVRLKEALNELLSIADKV